LTGRPSSIAIVGGWHQSSVLAAGFAEIGHDVTGIAEPAAAMGLAQGRAPLFEPGLDDLLAQGIQSGRLRFTSSFQEGLRHAEFVFISIDTPVRDDDTSDLDLIWRSVEQLAAAPPGTPVVVTAQVPVGTSHEIARRSGRSVAYVPEFLRLGTALETFRQADRFVIGADDPDLARRIATIYQPLGRPLHFTTVRTAEMAKHASNAFLATSVSFINEISDLCEREGADVKEVAAILKLDRRIGPNAFLSAGLGFAGGTLGREIKALQMLGASHGVATDVFDAVERVNARRVPHMVEILRSSAGGIRGSRVAVFGLTYKTGTSTLRRSAALTLIGLLVAEGASVSAFDPLAQPDETAHLPPFELHREPAPVLTGASALFLMAPWPDSIPFDAAASLMARPLLIDTGNYLDAPAASAAGFAYHGVGR